MRGRFTLVMAVAAVLLLAGGAYLAFGRGGGGAQARSIDLVVSGESMRPDRISVHQGDTVTLSVTTDRKEEIHLHGYDLKFEPEQASQKVTKTFTADKTGAFEIEIEDLSKTVGELEVTPR